MNRWNIPDDLEQEVLDRDRACVYCRVPFDDPLAPRARQPSWEHIINDERIVTRENIARCCMGCNASKGTKALTVWIRSRYCVARGIKPETVAPVIRAALDAAAGP
jgi:hypothetical protein